MYRFAVVLLLLPSLDQAADAPPKTKDGIDAGTVAAYEKVGACYGGFVKGSFDNQHFKEGKEAATKGLPGFRLTSLADGKLPRLPLVSVPFALDLSYKEVTDADLKRLAGLKNLCHLDLGYNAEVTDAGLKELADLKNLAFLDLSGSKVTDAGVAHLVGLNKLSSLSLGYTKVTNAGMKKLAGLKSLAFLSLAGTDVTGAGLKQLVAVRSA